MSDYTPDLRFRFARVEDYEEVIALRDVDEGWDPLPHSYHALMRDNQVIGLIAESNNEIVSMALNMKEPKHSIRQSTHCFLLEGVTLRYPIYLSCM